MNLVEHANRYMNEDEYYDPRKLELIEWDVRSWADEDTPEQFTFKAGTQESPYLDNIPMSVKDGKIFIGNNYDLEIGEFNSNYVDDYLKDKDTKKVTQYDKYNFPLDSGIPDNLTEVFFQEIAEEVIDLIDANKVDDARNVWNNFLKDTTDLIVDFDDIEIYGNGWDGKIFLDADSKYDITKFIDSQKLKELFEEISELIYYEASDRMGPDY